MDNLIPFFMKAIQKEDIHRPPFWLMRQAGRYLPEYRDIRKQAGSFLNLCYTPEYATEVTLQPIERYDFDAAILFSDILVIPDALGISVTFKEGVGPVLPHIPEDSLSDYANKLKRISLQKDVLDQTLSPVYKTVENVRCTLPKDKALIGFCGAPWTVLLYILEEKPSKGCERTRGLFYTHPEIVQTYTDALIEASVHYLSQQIESGANVIQIFDSWAVHVPATLFETFIQKPLYTLCKRLKKKYPHIPIILFPRGLNQEQLKRLVFERNSCFDVLSLDYTLDMTWAHNTLQDHICLQGNMDPAVLLSTPEKVKEEVLRLLSLMMQKPGYIFNLGHGILPQVPLKNVEILCHTIQNWHK